MLTKIQQLRILGAEGLIPLRPRFKKKQSFMIRTVSQKAKDIPDRTAYLVNKKVKWLSQSYVELMWVALKHFYTLKRIFIWQN